MSNSKSSDVAQRTPESHSDGLWHVILTRFSYRNPTQVFEARRKAADQAVRRIDPLDPKRLEFRAGLFELTCAPSLLAQTNQNFDWVVIVDKCLPRRYRDLLEDLVVSRPRTHLHEFSPAEDLTRSAWLKPYAPTDVTLLLTTVLDDDDALPSGFVESIQTYIMESRSVAPIMTFGSKSCVQWEAISSSRAPLGYRSSWHRGNCVMSAGFSLLCKYPEVALTVFSIDHVLGDFWDKEGQHIGLDFLDKELDDFRAHAGPFLEASKRWSARHGAELFVDVSRKSGPVVMTNHFFNDEAWRILEHKADRRRVILGDESFPRVMLKLESFADKSKLYSKRWSVYIALLRQAFSASQIPVNVWQRHRLTVALWMTWRFVIL